MSELNNNIISNDTKPYRIGYVPGVYDLFHIGHLNLIHKAKEKSEYLIVGILTDELVEYFKGRKPYISFTERMSIVGAIREVDEVVQVDFSNTVKMDAWKLYHYDAYFSGSDHGCEWEAERDMLRGVGSDIVFFPYTESTSSTMIKKTLQENKPSKRIYLFGSGRIGQRTLQAILESEDKTNWKIEGFLDNAEEKHLTKVAGYPVYYPVDLWTLEDDSDYQIIIAVKEKDMVKKQLRELGIEEHEFTIYEE